MSYLLKITLSVLVIVGLIAISTQLGAASSGAIGEWNQVISQRLARALLALMVGAMLGAAGTLCQSVIRNPLASPDILGVTHGASLVAVGSLALFPGLPSHWLPLSCFIGALMAALLLKWVIGKRHKSVLFVALSGIAISAWFAAMTDYLLIGHAQSTAAALLWLTGSLWGKSWETVWLLIPWCSLLLVALSLSSRLNLLLLGREQASLIGANTDKIQQVALLLAILLTAVTVAYCGPLTFIGLIAPHIARYRVGGKHQRLLPMAMLMGGTIVLAADLLGRTLLSPAEIPVGIIIALLAAPYFLIILIRYKEPLYA